MENIELVKSLVAIGGVAIIMGIVQVLKPFVTDGRLYPVIAVFLGLILNIAATTVLCYVAAVDWMAAVVNGIMAGLAFSGLYSVVAPPA